MNELKYKITLIPIAFAGAIIFFLIVYFPGVSVTPDSVYYISVARNILTGNGLTGYDGFPLVLQPPLYSLMLFLIKIITNLNFLNTAGLFNALLFGGTIYLSGLLLKKYLHSFVLIIAGIFLIITSSIILKVYLSAISEPLFIFLSLLFLYFIDEYLIKKSYRLLLLLSLITAAAVMTRYIGVVFAATGIISILINKGKFSPKKFFRIISYFSISLITFFAWMIRNYMISQSPMGSRSESFFTLRQNLLLTYHTIAEYFWIPEYYNGYLILIGVLISSLFIIFLLKRKNQVNSVFSFHHTLLIYIIVYLLTLIITSSIYAYDKIGGRLLSPVFIPIIILLVSATDKMLIKHNLFIKIIAAAGLLFFINFSLQNSYFLINDYLKNSGWEYSDKSWSDNTVVRFIKKMDTTKCRLYSNAPDAVYFFTKKEVRWSPLKTYYNSNVNVDKTQSFYEIKQKEKKYLIWFNNIQRSFLYNTAELNSTLQLKKVSKLKDGEIFEIIN